MAAVFAVAAALVCGPAATASAWSLTVHQAVTSRAVDTLPKPIKAFYEAHRLEMPSLGPEAELPPEEALEEAGEGETASEEGTSEEESEEVIEDVSELGEDEDDVAEVMDNVDEDEEL